MRRRLVIFAILAVFVGAIIAAAYFLTAYKAPSCTDGKQDQNETGIDCGGSCSYLCTESEAAPSVRFARALSPTPGRTDVIAYVDNPNPGAAAHALHYTIQLYDSGNVVVAQKEGTVDLPPNSTVPIYVPYFFSGSQIVARTFLTFDTPAHLWFSYKDDRVVPQAKDVVVTAGDMPRITARAVNPSAVLLTDVPFVVTVFDANGNVIAASETLAPAIPPQGTVSLVFTWPTPFPGAVSKVEIEPVVPLTHYPS